MSGKVVFEVTRGALTGQKYEYDEKTRVFVGRQEDCGIVVPESTVSRYHCVIEITPPEVKLQDFHSLNGTFLNGNKIGQRDRDQSFEEAKNAQAESDAFFLHNGDVLGLGSKCELRVDIEAAECCSKCGRELGEAAQSEGTAPDDKADTAAYYDNAGERVCADCHLELEEKRVAALIAERKQKEEQARLLEIERQKEAEEAERKRLEAEQEEQKRKEALRLEQERIKREKNEKLRKEREQKAKEEQARLQKEKEERERKERERVKAQKRAEEEQREAVKRREEAERLAAELQAKLAAKPKAQQKKCPVCGKLFTPKAPDGNLCENCLADPAKIIDAILFQILGDAGVRQEQKAGAPAIVEGFDKVALLGKGGMGEVWKVKERKTGKFYALKTMLPQVAADDRAKKLFLREASVCQCLKHKNVVNAYKTGCTDGVFYILMDLCEGGSVDRLMQQKGGKLSIELATYIFVQVLTGLEYVHNMDIEVEIKKGVFGGTKNVDAKGVVHRDFKPGNIFLSDKTDHPVAMVADFGMAKAFDTAGLSKITTTGVVMGTCVFMPRQQAMNFKLAKPEVDVWAAAASYYNMLTGALPKDFPPNKNPWQIIVSAPAVPIRKRDPSIPQKLAEVIDRALVDQPCLKYQSAEILKRDIVDALPSSVRNAVKGVLR